MCHYIVGAAELSGREGNGGRGSADVVLPEEGSGEGIDHDDKDSGHCHKRGGADDDKKQQERFVEDARRQQWRR